MWATLSVDGAIERRDGVPTLEQAQEAVGGWIEVVGLPDETMVINEEGKLLGLRRNKPATRLARGLLMPDDWIAGPAVFVGPTDDEGEWTSLPEETLERLRQAVSG